MLEPSVIDVKSLAEAGRLVRLAPLIAGKVAGNLASGNVPDVRSEAEVELVTLAVFKATAGSAVSLSNREVADNALPASTLGVPADVARVPSG